MWVLICLQCILVWMLPNAFAGQTGSPGSKWEGVVIHEMPELYEADGKTLKNGSRKTALRMITNRPEIEGVGDALGQLVPILRMAVGAINKNPKILPDYVVELHLCESGCAPQFAVHSILRQIYTHSKGYFHMQFGPLCSGPTAAVNDIVQGFQLFQIATISRSDVPAGGLRYPYLCRTSPALESLADGLAKFFQLFGWTKVGAVYDSRSLSAATVNAFKGAVRSSVAGTDKFERNGGFSEAYMFDVDFLDANTFQIDGYNFKEADVVETLKSRKVRVYLLAISEDAGAHWYCEVFRAGLAGTMNSVLAFGWWDDAWIKEQVDAFPDIRCTPDEVFKASKTMFSFGQSAFILDNVRKHGITDIVLSEIRNQYFDPVDGCTSPKYTGCHTHLASYNYDSFALAAMAFHQWIYEQGHRLSEIDYENPGPQQQLYNITKHMKFLGVTGMVEFFNSTDPDCERKGMFSIRQYRTLALKSGGSGWADITSFTNTDGFASSASPWTPVIWWDGTQTLPGTGYGWRQTSPGRPANYDNAIGLENIPTDWLVITCLPGQEPDVNGTVCQQCKPGRASAGGTEVYCVSCAVGYFSAAAGQSACDRCEQGQWANDGFTVCQDCPEGTRGVKGICELCGSGRYSAGTGNRLCTTCEKGRYQPLAGQGSCSVCQPGNVSNDADPSWCKMCEPGFYQDQPEKGECYRCPPGRFMPAEGAPECTLCKNSRITAFEGALNEEDCICPEDSYEPEELSSANSECEPCREGMVCEQGSALRDWSLFLSGGSTANDTRRLRYPKLKVKYFSEAGRPVFVYRCLEDDDCPGGNPGTCAEGKIGLACGRCEKGWYAFGGICHKCSAVETTMVLFPILPCVVGPPLLYYLYTRLLEPSRGSHMDSVQNQALASVFFIIVHFSSVGTIRHFNLNVPELVKFTWEAMGTVNLGIQLLRPECVDGGKMSDFSFQFTLHSLLPIFVGIFFGVDYILSLAVARLLRRCRNCKGMFGRCAQGMELRPTINAYGTLIYFFSIPILAMAFDLFECFEHPNGLESMHVAPGVLCYEETWNELLVVGIGSISLYCVGSLVIASWVCVKAPSSFGNPEFRKTWNFLLVKWKPNRWWFGQVFLLKGILLILPLVIFQHGALQSFWASLVLNAYIGFVGILHPWRHERSNQLDVCVNASLSGVALISIYFSESMGDATSPLEIFMLVFTLLPLVATAGSFVHSLTLSSSSITHNAEAALEVHKQIQRLVAISPPQVITGCANLTQPEARLLLESLNTLILEVDCTSAGNSRLAPRLAAREEPARHNGEEHQPFVDVPSMLREPFDSSQSGPSSSKGQKSSLEPYSPTEFWAPDEVQKVEPEPEAEVSNGLLFAMSPRPAPEFSDDPFHPTTPRGHLLAPLKAIGATGPRSPRVPLVPHVQSDCSTPRGRPGPDVELPQPVDVPVPMSFDWE